MIQEDHAAMFEYAEYTRNNSPIARAYLELHDLLDTVWHCMNDVDPPPFPMDNIARVIDKKEREP